MNKDTALARVDKVRELISRLPEDARILDAYLDQLIDGKLFTTVFVSHPISALGENYTVYEHDDNECPYEHRYYPADDLEDAGYIYLATSKEAVK